MVDDIFYVSELGPCSGLEYGQVEDYGVVVFKKEEVLTTDSDISKTENAVLYPNPSTGVVYIKESGNLKELSVFNALGQIVTVPSFDEGFVDCSLLPKGIYYFNLIWEGKSHTQSVMIK